MIEPLTLCTICARGGSKGVPNKNVRLLAGKPLIAHGIERALEAGIFAAIAVSSDSEAILDIAQRAGATHLIRRPDELATDKAAKIPVIRHAMLTAEEMTGLTFDIVVDLDATSPLRLVEDILAARQLLLDSDARSIITAMPARRSPYFNMVELDEEGWARLPIRSESTVFSRQTAPPCYDMNASIYVWHRASLLVAQSALAERTGVHLMPEERSIDIDTELDFRVVEFLMRERSGRA